MIETPFDDVVNDQNSVAPEAVEKLNQQFELAEAAERFRKEFAERSFSERHEEFGKMINCRLCGRRHREDDPLFKESTAHGPQKFVTFPSRHIAFKKQRVNPHHNDRIRRFAYLTTKIFTEDIAPYFNPSTDEEKDYLVRRAQRKAAHILRKFWIAPRLARKHMQDVSRRINRGLLPGGSR